MSVAEEGAEIVGSAVSSGVSSIGATVVGYVAAGLAAVLLAMGGWIWVLKGEVARGELALNEQKAVVAMKELQISAFVASVDKQNAAVEAMRNNVKEATEKMAAVQSKVETKYSTVAVKDGSCEAKVAAYEQVLKIFTGSGK